MFDAIEFEFHRGVKTDSRKLEKLINDLKRRCEWVSQPGSEMYGHEMLMSTAIVGNR